MVRDYDHRKGMIDVTIALHNVVAAAGSTVVMFDSYFDKTGSNRKGQPMEAKTKITLDAGARFYIPDGVMITEHDTTQTLYLIEMFCDAAATRVQKQLYTHMEAIAHGAPGNRYGLRANPFVLSVFKHPNVLASTVQKMAKLNDFDSFAPYFFFASLDSVKSDAAHAFTTITGQLLSLTD